MKLTCRLLCVLLPLLTCAQSGLRAVPTQVVWEARAPAFRFSDVFSFCDANQDGVTPIDLEAIQNYTLNNHIGAFGSRQGIYLCTRLKRLHLITNLDNSPQKSQLCAGFSSAVGNAFGFLDVAIDQNGDSYVSSYGKIFKVDQAMCVELAAIDLNIDGGITALSFDRHHNMYLGGFDSAIYRLNNGNYSTPVLWHDFGQGAAAGDFVMWNNKMYVAWNTTSGCRLYEVTVDGNTQYVSHSDLGALPDNTFGLASELGRLYGVTPDRLYLVNQNPLTFTAVLDNNNPNDQWYGAAGRHEAVHFETAVFASYSDAQTTTNALPAIWTNTTPFAQTVYVAIRNVQSGQQIIVPIEIAVNPAPFYHDPVNTTHCAGDPDAHQFDLQSFTAGILGSQAGIGVSYHDNAADAHAGIHPLPDVVSIADTKTVFARLTSASGCSTVFDFTLTVPPTPVYNQPPDLRVCEFSESVDLMQQVPAIIGAQAASLQVTFYTSANDALQKINPVGPMLFPGNQTIFARIENAATGCFDMGYFQIVIRRGHQDIKLPYRIETLDWTADQNVIQVHATGLYSYSLDGVHFQQQPYFDHLAPGDYELTVRDPEQCATSVSTVVLLIYPRYFTPNGDGHHDVWQIKPISDEARMEVEIYDRYGKAIAKFSGRNGSWDGTLNGAPLPASDYWFTVYRSGGKVYKGHFTLKR